MVMGEPGVGEICPEDPPEDLERDQERALQAGSAGVVADDDLPDPVLLPECISIAPCERGWRGRDQEYLLLPHLSFPWTLLD